MADTALDYDPEKARNFDPNHGPTFEQGGIEKTKEPWTRRFVDSFKRDENAHVINPAEAEAAGAGKAGHGGFDHAGAAAATANSGLARKLKGRHMQMIAIGGSIGELGLSRLARDGLTKVLTVSRNWSFRYFWCCFVDRRTRIIGYCLWNYWYSYVLYCSSIGRAGSAFPCRGFVLGL